MKKLLIVICFISIAGILCNIPTQRVNAVPRPGYEWDNGGQYAYRLVTVGNCEYIVFVDVGIVHKGDCKNVRGHVTPNN